ncbi:hypothetical protein AAC387_Pa10g1046 [Persea americana]
MRPRALRSSIFSSTDENPKRSESISSAYLFPAAFSNPISLQTTVVFQHPLFPLRLPAATKSKNRGCYVRR